MVNSDLIQDNIVSNFLLFPLRVMYLQENALRSGLRIANIKRLYLLFCMKMKRYVVMLERLYFNHEKTRGNLQIQRSPHCLQQCWNYTPL